MTNRQITDQPKTNWKLSNHIPGKAYDLTQDNMNAMIADIEKLNATLTAWERQDVHESMECYQTNKRLKEALAIARSALEEVADYDSVGECYALANKALKKISQLTADDE